MKPPPKPRLTQATLAEALGVTPRRLRQLKSDGMPCDSADSARRWREANGQATSGATLEELRRRRIDLLDRQIARQDIENKARRGELVSRAEIQSGYVTITSMARDQFLRIAHEAPPRVAGLGEAATERVLRELVATILREMQADLLALHVEKPGDGNGS